jgi:prephenate dehydratase/chorismate mutase/prephenate dehydratase
MTPMKSATQIFDAMNRDEVDFAVVALENTVEGFVGETTDLLLKYDTVQIFDMLWLPVRFDAVQLQPGTPKTISAHPHALKQCRNFIESEQVIEVPALSNSAAATNLSGTDLALVPHGTHYFGHLNVYKELVQDYDNAATQFMLLFNASRADLFLPDLRSEHNLWVVIPDTERQGCLFEILAVINERRINITTLYSRPIKGMENIYSFYLTLDCTKAESDECMREVSELGVKTVFLGGWS